MKREAEARKRAEEKMKRVMSKLAIKMLEANEPIDRIVEETGLSDEEIKRL